MSKGVRRLLCTSRSIIKMLMYYSEYSNKLKYVRSYLKGKPLVMFKILSMELFELMSNKKTQIVAPGNGRILYASKRQRMMK